MGIATVLRLACKTEVGLGSRWIAIGRVVILAAQGPCTVTKRADNLGMHPSLDIFRNAVALACQRHAVRSLDVFGSAAGRGFDPSHSDIDLIVTFSDRAGPALFEHCFDLKQQLETVFNRPVDLVMEGALRNPHFIQAVNRTREPIYASPQPEAA